MTCVTGWMPRRAGCINSVDARGVVQHPEQTRLAATDFYQAGTSFSYGPLALSADVFRIDHSNEQVLGL